jgi:hypothetical protein
MYHLFNRLGNNKSSVKFHFRVLQNKRLIEPEIKALEEANEPLPEFQEFEKLRMEVCEQFCEKDESGKPVIQNNNFNIPDDKQEEFQATLEKLKEEHKEALDKVEERRTQFEELLKEEVEIDFVRFKIQEMPESLLGSDLEIMFDIVDEE